MQILAYVSHTTEEICYPSEPYRMTKEIRKDGGIFTKFQPGIPELRQVTVDGKMCVLEFVFREVFNCITSNDS